LDEHTLVVVVQYHMSLDRIVIDLEQVVLEMFEYDHKFSILDSNINQLNMEEHRRFHHYIVQMLEH
jgi:hypothetical protein